MTNKQPNGHRTASDVLTNILRKTLADGSHVAEVPIRGGKFVTIDDTDLARLISLGISPAWFLNSNGKAQHYVRAQAPARSGVPNLVQVARVIMEPLPGCIVKHRDGDRLNLRRANLISVAAPSRAKARERFFDRLPVAA